MIKHKVVWGLLVAMTLAVHGCSTPKDATTLMVEHRQKECPPIRIDRATDRFVALAGTGKDASVALTAVVQSITGDCQVDLKKKTTDIVLHATFTVTRGPGWTGNSPALRYFVAIPAFYPNPAGKQLFDVPVVFADPKSDTASLVDDDIHVLIPMGAATTVELPVYVGFQLTAADQAALQVSKPPVNGPTLLK